MLCVKRCCNKIRNHYNTIIQQPPVIGQSMDTGFTQLRPERKSETAMPLPFFQHATYRRYLFSMLLKGNSPVVFTPLLCYYKLKY